MEEDGTMWNIGTACSKSQGYYYSIIKFKPCKTKLDYCGTSKLGFWNTKCRKTGKCIDLSRELNQKCNFFYFTVGSQFGSSLIDTAVEIARIPARSSASPSYIHSFGMSKNYIVLIEQPLFLEDDHVKAGCTSNSSDDKVSVDTPRRQNYTWKRGDMVRFQQIVN